MNKKEEFVINNYEIWPDGSVYSPFTRKYLKLREDKDGYYDVTLVYDKNGNRMPFKIHRLVALAYLPNRPDGYNVINHKDLNKKNNRPENLEWSTVALNTQHAYDNNAYSNIKKVKVTTLDGNVIIFQSTSHASRYFKYSNPSTIQAILEGRLNNPISSGKRKGLYFEYTNESVTTIERVVPTIGNE